MNIDHLNQLSLEVRRNVIEYAKVGTVYHFGGELSCVEIMVYIYSEFIGDLNQKKRSQFIMSKGHSCFSLYCLLAQMGYFDKEELYSYKQLDSVFQGHPDMKKSSYIDFSSGSLGQGLSVGVGKALANRLHGDLDKIYVLLGDGELNEGQIWEAAMSAAKFKLDNLVALVDLNGQQVDGDTSEVMPLIHLEEKWSSFGWDVAFVDNGHDFNLIHQSLSLTREKPMVVILKTVKGKGISFMESNKLWHSNKLDEELKKKALGEVGMNVG